MLNKIILQLCIYMEREAEFKNSFKIVSSCSYNMSRNKFQNKIINYKWV